ncbi:MAG: WecB/TagA/CpsF family glycosyltransferase, partial [Bacteroidota bacterium]
MSAVLQNVSLLKDPSTASRENARSVDISVEGSPLSVESSRLFGIRVDKLTPQLVGQWVEDRIETRSFSNNIVVINVAKLIHARKDARLRSIIETADLVSADGEPLVWASRILRQSLPAKVTGIDLMFHLLNKSNSKEWSVYFLGAEEGVIRTVVEKVALE